MARVWAKLPATRKLHPPRLIRGRSAGTTRGSTSRCGPSGSSSGPAATRLAEPEIHDAHLEEVRSGHSRGAAAEHHAAATGGAVVWDARMEELGAPLPRAVLSWVGPDGFPLAVRVPVAVDCRAHRIALGAEPAGPAAGRGPGVPHRPLPRRASSTGRRTSRCAGTSSATPGGWSLVPQQAGRRLRAARTRARRPVPANLSKVDPLLPTPGRASRAMSAGPSDRGLDTGRETARARRARARRIGVHTGLLHLGAEPREQLAGVVERLPVLVGAELVEPPHEVELAIGDPEVDLVRASAPPSRGTPGLNSSRSATGSWSAGTVARKRLLKSIDSNSTLRRLRPPARPARRPRPTRR